MDRPRRMHIPASPVADMPNGNDRGGTRDRRARKLFLLNRDGDGEKAPCCECGTVVTYETMVVDRIVPAIFGGTYCRNNIQVHCHPCSNRQGKKLSMTLFRSVTHQEVWIEHHCERCFHYSEEEGRACPILARALSTGRKPKQWDRNTKAQLMKDTIRCNEETRRPPKLEAVKDFEDVPMFDLEPHEANYVPVEGLPTQRRPSSKDTDHA